jgi:hypothetical protein
MSLSTPQQVMERLQGIEQELADSTNELEQAAYGWFRKKRDKEHDEAVAFMSAEGTDTKRRMVAKRETSHIGMEEEALYEALRARVRTLETRATIGMALLKTQGRA